MGGTFKEGRVVKKGLFKRKMIGQMGGTFKEGRVVLENH